MMGIWILNPSTNPESDNDFRPISLLNSSIKILTKLLVHRLQLVILTLIHVSKYGFITNMTIQDCLAWSFKYIHQCHQSKKENLILKLDFAKAFDTVEHCTIVQMMEHLGFPSKMVTVDEFNHEFRNLFCVAEWSPR